MEKELYEILTRLCAVAGISIPEDKETIDLLEILQQLEEKGIFPQSLLDEIENVLK